MLDFLKEDRVSSVMINGERFEFAGGNVTIKDGKVIAGGKTIKAELKTHNAITINGNVDRLRCDGSVTVYGDCGEIECGGSCTAKGDVFGGISAGGSVSCGRVNGKVTAGGKVSMSK